MVTPRGLLTRYPGNLAHILLTRHLKISFPVTGFSEKINKIIL